MAITERYVTTGASGGDGQIGTPWTLTESFTNAVAADRINVKKGTYTLTSTTSVPSNVGTTTSPIIWRGYNSAIADLDGNQRLFNGTGVIDTTNFPIINYTTGRLDSTNYTFWQNLKLD